jgi:hypothetical protein
VNVGQVSWDGYQGRQQVSTVQREPGKCTVEEVQEGSEKADAHMRHGPNGGASVQD